MTPAQFRKLALSMPEVSEGKHMGHPDFRAHGKIVASVGVPDDQWGMVKLTPEQQAMFCESHSDVFAPCAGAWGRAGCTAVRLKPARVAIIRESLQTAVQNQADSVLRKQFKHPRKTRRAK